MRFGLIPDQEGRELLLFGTPEGWTLPAYHERESLEINRVIKDRYGLQVTVLRHATAYDELELHDPVLAPGQEARWFSAKELEALVPADTAQGAVIESWFSGKNRSFSQRPPWSYPGWFERASAWIREETGRRESIVQHHLRPNSCVLRSGSRHFKAVAGINAAEPAVTALLAERFPDLVPAVLAMDVDRGWMLQKDGGIPLRSLTHKPADLGRWRQVLRVFARMQIESAGMLDSLLATGLEDRRLDRIPALYEGLVDSPRLLGGEHPEGIPEVEFSSMWRRRGEVRQLCDELAAYQIPETIRHDDFHANNIMVDGERFGVIDWGESYAGHPFGSLFMALRYAAYLLDLEEGGPELIALRDVYLKEWTDWEPLPRLVEAYQGAARLQMLSRALTWHDFMSSVDPELISEYEGSAEYWLRLFMGLDPD
jgi:hypothetical protein